jgi:hypothetical protein
MPMRKISLSFLLISLILGPFISISRAEISDKVIVYYFHTDYRCATCYKMQLYTKEAVGKYFASEIDAGMVELKVINTDEKENSHFLKDYQLYTKSVVVSLIREGEEKKYKNLAKIWDYVGDKDTFYEYIKTETSAYLTELKE